MEKLALKANKLKKIYTTLSEDIIALKGIGIEIKEGEFVSIMGPSGAGKTTFLNLAGCLDILSSGELEVMGYNPSRLKESELAKVRINTIGFVFEEFLLISSLTALENVSFPLLLTGNYKNNNRPKLLLEKLGLGHRINHFPKELSGGETQRVAVARALVNRPRILLADEPTGNLDTKNAQGIFELFDKLNKEEGLTIIVATHNTKLAYKARRIIHLCDGNIAEDKWKE